MPKAARTLMVLALLTISCAGRNGAPRVDDVGRADELEGVLVEARHYFETGATGGDHTFCAFVSALAEIPVGVLLQNGKLVILTDRPSRLAPYVSRRVRIRGVLDGGGYLMVAASLSVRDGAGWTAVAL